MRHQLYNTLIDALKLWKIRRLAAVLYTTWVTVSTYISVRVADWTLRRIIEMIHFYRMGFFLITFLMFVIIVIVYFQGNCWWIDVVENMQKF